MTAPSREDLDRAIDSIAERLTRTSGGGSIIAEAAAGQAGVSPATLSALSAVVHADALSLSALLAYRAASARIDMDRAEIGGGQ